MRAGLLLLAALFCFSALLKSLSPWTAIAALNWTGFDYTHRLLIACVGIGLESLAAAALLLLGHRASHLGALILVLALLLLRVVSHAAGTEDCGCLGDVHAPSWILTALLVVGAVTCVLTLSSSNRARRLDRPPSRGRLIATTLIALAPVSPLPITLTYNASPQRQLLAEIGWTRDIGSILVIIGDSDCEKCQQALADLSEPGFRSRYVPFAQTYFAYRESSPSLTNQTLAHSLTAVRNSEKTWWKLLLKTPPTFLFGDPIRGLKSSSTWPPTGYAP